MKRLLLAVAALLVSGAPNARAQMPDGSANRAAMQRLSQMIGVWRGEGWMQRGPNRENTTMTETIQLQVEGTVLLIEGVGRSVAAAGSEPRVVHHALGVLSFDARANTYSLRSYVASGYWGDFAVTVNDVVLEWSREVPGGRIRNTARIANGEWHEVGEFSRDGTSWTTIMDLRLRRE